MRHNQILAMCVTSVRFMLSLTSISFIFWNSFFSLVKCNKTQSAIKTLMLIRPIPAPIVNISGSILNFPIIKKNVRLLVLFRQSFYEVPAVPLTFIMNLKPNALYNIRCSVFPTLNLFANLKLNPDAVLVSLKGTSNRVNVYFG